MAESITTESQLGAAQRGITDDEPPPDLEQLLSVFSAADRAIIDKFAAEIQRLRTENAALRESNDRLATIAMERGAR